MSTPSGSSDSPSYTWSRRGTRMGARDALSRGFSRGRGRSLTRSLGSLVLTSPLIISPLTHSLTHSLTHQLSLLTSPHSLTHCGTPHSPHSLTRARATRRVAHAFLTPHSHPHSSPHPARPSHLPPRGGWSSPSPSLHSFTSLPSPSPSLHFLGDEKLGCDHYFTMRHSPSKPRWHRPTPLGDVHLRARARSPPTRVSLSPSPTDDTPAHAPTLTVIARGARHDTDRPDDDRPSDSTFLNWTPPPASWCDPRDAPPRPSDPNVHLRVRALAQDPCVVPPDASSSPRGARPDHPNLPTFRTAPDTTRSPPRTYLPPRHPGALLLQSRGSVTSSPSDLAADASASGSAPISRSMSEYHAATVVQSSWRGFKAREGAREKRALVASGIASAAGEKNARKTPGTSAANFAAEVSRRPRVEGGVHGGTIRVVLRHVHFLRGVFLHIRIVSAENLLPDGFQRFVGSVRQGQSGGRRRDAVQEDGPSRAVRVRYPQPGVGLQLLHGLRGSGSAPDEDPFRNFRLRSVERGRRHGGTAIMPLRVFDLDEQALIKRAARWRAKKESEAKKTRERELSSPRRASAPTLPR